MQLLTIKNAYSPDPLFTHHPILPLSTQASLPAASSTFYQFPPTINKPLPTSTINQTTVYLSNPHDVNEHSNQEQRKFFNKIVDNISSKLLFIEESLDESMNLNDVSMTRIDNDKIIK